MTLLAVPCSGADTVAILDADHGEFLGDVEVGSHPVHLATVGNCVFVATMGERSVDVIADGDVTRIETGVLGPSHFAAVGETVFAPCTGGDVVAVLDATDRTPCGRIAVGGEPHDVVVHDGAVFVGSRADGTVSVVDPDSMAVLATHEFGDEARIQGLASTADRAYAVDQRGERVVALDRDGPEAVASVGANPYEVVVHGGRVYVPGRDDGTVTELTADLGSRTRRRLGGRPVDVVAHDDERWVLDRERPVLGELSTGDDVSLPAPSFAAAGDPDAFGRVYLTHYDDDAVSAVDLDERAVVWTTDLPAGPFEPLVV
ncbi:YncE family protein [Halorarum salinum]|uniref:40-residue YVTN family beta-propeller repeat-containing protein n=1 Tax=Halorarum salinum TaxID=2743089 RepID=A0A7D5LCN4_9EURY|nr:hypothetical protein [Halobaculum salinum]QLG63693.1 hypothetical protein HUG12_18950 [Halobaculum salinum]